LFDRVVEVALIIYASENVCQNLTELLQFHPEMHGEDQKNMVRGQGID
jgi:hypothetical protein